jgi:hypothetical protein
MRAELLSTDSPQWRQVLSSAPHDFYHLPEYVSLCAGHERGRPAALFVADAGRSLLLPLIIRPIPYGGDDATSPYGYPGPVVVGADGGQFLNRGMKVGVRLLASLGIASLFVRTHPLLNLNPPEGCGVLVRGGDTVSVDLTVSSTEHWRQTRADHRSGINRAIRAGSTAELDPEWLHLTSFVHLYRTTMERVGADPFYFFDESYFQGLRMALADKLHLWTVKRRDGELASAALFVETGGIVQYHLAASDPRFSRESPTKLLLHRVRAWAKDRGNHILHLGGGLGTEDDSLLQFKAGFSPHRHRYHTVRIIVDPGRYRDLTELHAARAGPNTRPRFFPAYRAPSTT